MITPTDYLRLALDPIRLAVLGQSVVSPVDVDSLAEALDADRKKVLSAVAQLTAAGLVDETGRLDSRRLQELGAALPQPEEATVAAAGAWSAEETEILNRFFTGSRLTQIPANHSKRLIVLERLAQEFEPGVRYPERQVNFMLQLFHADFATLRRYLVDEGFLTRADSVYWRTGGRTASVDSEQEAAQ